MTAYRVYVDVEHGAPTLAALHALLVARVPPADVRWHEMGRAQSGLFDAGTDHVDAASGEVAPVAAAAGTITPPLSASGISAGAHPSWQHAGLPAAFGQLARLVLMHADIDRFIRLHSYANAVAAGRRRWDDALDPDRLWLEGLARNVRREIHKTHAFVRFRPIDTPDGTRHVAWLEPQHAVLRAAAPFFAKRFASMAWSILSPRLSVHWDRERLHAAPGVQREQAPGADAGEALWLAYYASIFNPARVNPAAMAREMPRRYWDNLPEAQLITQLIQTAPERSARMQAAASETLRRLPLRTPAAAPPVRSPEARLTDLAMRARHCTDCPLAAPATQLVWGTGAVGARVMLVGEQPGDQEDLAGQPFVGPAGQLLQRAIAQLNWPRSALYLTNAVKHFRFELRGKRRLHKTPGQREVLACAQWLEAEIRAVSPQAIVALGSTAATSLLGRPVRVGDSAGRWLYRDDGRPVWVVHHPAAVLRRAESGAPDFEAWVASLAPAWSDVTYAGGIDKAALASSGSAAPRLRQPRY